MNTASIISQKHKTTNLPQTHFCVWYIPAMADELGTTAHGHQIWQNLIVVPGTCEEDALERAVSLLKAFSPFQVTITKVTGAAEKERELETLRLVIAGELSPASHRDKSAEYWQRFLEAGTNLSS